MPAPISMQEEASKNSSSNLLELLSNWCNLEVVVQHYYFQVAPSGEAPLEVAAVVLWSLLQVNIVKY